MKRKGIPLLIIFLILTFTSPASFSARIDFHDYSILNQADIISQSDQQIRIRLPWLSNKELTLDQNDIKTIRNDFDIPIAIGSTTLQSIETEGGLFSVQGNSFSGQEGIAFGPVNDVYKVKNMQGSANDRSTAHLIPAGSGKRALCLIQSEFSPPWACSCGRFRSQFDIMKACMNDEIDLNDIDCDGVNNNEDLFPFIPYSHYQWKIARPDIWRRYRVRFDAATKQYVVNVKIYFQFPDSISHQEAIAYTNIWRQTAEKHYSNDRVRFEFSFTSNKHSEIGTSVFTKYLLRFLIPDYFDYIVEVTNDLYRFHAASGSLQWSLRWSLKDAGIVGAPYKIMLHELCHLIGLNDSYVEKDWRAQVIKSLSHHHADPEDIGDRESITSSVNLKVKDNHYFRILGIGSCR